MMNQNTRTRLFYGLVILLIIILFVMLFSIQQDDFGSESASLPVNQNIPLKGVWQVRHIEYLSDTEASLGLDSKFYVDKGLVALGEAYTVRPSFKSKFVNVNSFLTYKYTEFPLIDDFKDQYARIITISDGERFYQEVMQIDESTIALVHNSNFYVLERISKQVLDSTIEEYNNIYQQSQGLAQGSSENDLAVLLGFKTKYPAEEEKNPDYRTFFIRIKRDNSMNVYLTDNLFVPRQEGFWTISLKENLVDDSKESSTPQMEKKGTGFRLLAGPYGKEENTIRVVNAPIEINYLGPGYLATSIYQEVSKPSYSIFPLDRYDNLQGISIEEIAGENGILALEETISSKQADWNLSSSESTKPNLANLNRNIGVRRKNGHWYFMTNLQYTVNNEVKTTDIDLNVIPDVDILREPDLPMKWNNVKNLVPNAIDAISSPDGRIMIVQTSEELLIYDLRDFSNLIGSIPLSNTDTLVMHEWAIGDFPENWENEFKKTKRRPVHYFKE